MGDVSDEAYTLQELVQTQAIEIKVIQNGFIFLNNNNGWFFAIPFP